MSGEATLPTVEESEPWVEGSKPWDLANLARPRRLCDWIFEQFSGHIARDVVEVGAGIGTFSERLLAAGAERLLLVEPDRPCVQVLERRFGEDPRVRVAAEQLPDSAALIEGSPFGFILCQNVLEHIENHEDAVAAMARALRPGGWMTLLVPAHQRLYGALDRSYGHHRRYSRQLLRQLVEAAGLELVDIYSFNLLGIPGWWVQNRRSSPGISPASLNAYEALLRLWRPIERRVRPPWGLSLIAHARRPAPTGDSDRSAARGEAARADA